MSGALDVERLAAVLRRVEELELHDIAQEIATAGVLVLPTLPGDKAPLLTTAHTDRCTTCRGAGLHGERDHGATIDPTTIDRYWEAHPDAGVAMKNHPRLLRLDGDHDSAAAMKAHRKSVGYGRDEPAPFRAPTPGGMYRERVIHLQPEGQTLGGGGTPALGYSCYGESGYIVVAGRHPNGHPYRNFYGDTITPTPIAFLAALQRRQSDDGGPALVAASTGDVKEFLASLVGTERLATLARRRRLVANAAHGERHVTAMRELVLGFRDALAGWVPATVVRNAVHQGLQDAGWESDRFGEEFDAMVAWAVAQVIHLDPDTVRQEAEQRIRLAADHDLTPPDDDGARDLTDAELDAIEAAQHLGRGELEPTDDDEHAPALARDGATFILDEPAELDPRWGRDGEVLWAKGEPLVIVGPPGVGKTTLGGQVLAGLVGIAGEALGLPVARARKVLFLAMDRPRQVRRALRRRFGEQHRQALAEHLIVRPGPLPADLGKNPALLVELARHYGADVVIIDSLKDAAVKLTDDEVGGNVNRAIQMCVATDIDVLVLHHQRKGQGGTKPTSLEDVYGSTWITAGAGSVILLWGEAGSELVEMTHLKQPADPVGPWTIEHDHHTGRSTSPAGSTPSPSSSTAGPREPPWPTRHRPSTAPHRRQGVRSGSEPSGD